MSRTYRRRGQRHEYRWVLRDWKWSNHAHSDAERTIQSGPPRRYRRVFDHRLRTLNFSQFRRWLDDSGYDPVFQVRHRHSASWSSW